MSGSNPFYVGTIMTGSRKPCYRRRVDAAEYVREKWGLPCSPAWLAKLAVVGGGPTYQKAGRTPLYTDENLDAWAESRLSPPMRSTSDVEAGDK
jgi:hypothetical protein